MSAPVVVLPPGSYHGALPDLHEAAADYRPPPRLTPSEFADAELIVTSGPLEGTRWRTDFAPYQRGILDACMEPGVDTVVVMSSSQVGKTSICLALLAYYVAYDPCRIMVVQPTLRPMAEDFSTDRLDPMIAASDRLRELVAAPRSSDGRNTTLAKSFPGGSISISGANSAASLASRSIRVLVLDEIDRYPAEVGDEGSPIDVALKRTQAFQGGDRLRLLISTPTLSGGPIDTWHQLGDCRRYHVPCPSCGTFHAYEWANVRRDDGVRFGKQPGDAERARLWCPHCEYKISDVERRALLKRGRWVAEHPDRDDPSIVSFHLWEAYSPFSSLSDIVAGFLRANRDAKAGDKRKLHTWTNTTAGEPWAPAQGEGASAEIIYARRERFAAPVPAGAVCLTAGIDVQDDRLEALIVGWGIGETSWFVHHALIVGDTSQPPPWDSLSELLRRTWRHESDALLRVEVACIDTAGHRTDTTYSYVKDQRDAGININAIIGRDGTRPVISAPRKQKIGRVTRPVVLFTVGVDGVKGTILGRLSKAHPDNPGYVHLPDEDWCSLEFVEQLTSERLITRYVNGQPVQKWIKLRPRNEALDMAGYAYAALKLLRPDLESMARNIGGGAPVRKRPKKRAQSNWLRPGGGSGGWLPRR